VTDSKQLTPDAHVLREDDRDVGSFLQQLLVALETEDLEAAHESE
jgi:hypothetical protein